jgi:small-conductance mechanosensitive channel
VLARVSPALVAAWWLVVAACALAQIPGLPKSVEDAKAPAAGTAAAAPARFVDLLDEARALRDRLGTSVPAGVPDGVTPEQLGTLRQALGQFMFAVEGEVRARAEIADAKKARADAEAASRQWTGFADPPPYSILMVDALRETTDTLRTKIAALQAGQAVAAREVERFQADVRRSDAALRQAREAASLAPPDQAALAAWRVDAAQWAVRSTTAAAQVLQRRVEASVEQMHADQANLELAERKLAVASRNLRFSAEDLERVRQNERDRTASIDKDLAAALQRALQAGRERDEASRALEALRANPATPAARLEVAEARLRAADAAVASSRFETDVLDMLGSVARSTHDLWKLRYDAINSPDADKRREATARLKTIGERLMPWRDLAEAQLAIVESARREQRLRLADAGPTPDALRYENAIRDSLAHRTATAQRLHDSADRLEHAVSRWIREFEVEEQARPWPERLAGAWATAKLAARQLWNFEMFEVEDTVEAEGQKLTVSRGVTVGKSVGALLLFVFGYWIAARLARRLEQLLVGRFGVEAAPARTTRRWVLALWGLVLAAITLNLARIPLTVFAFLGGALAIGVGFGTQTIIRNFISGLILLMERQVRVGDTVEVEGVTGTVTEVNLRSSTVLADTGVEAIIPNSALLENRVTNWTHTDRRLRRAVRVGVAYGSKARDVADVLKDCADRHGLVLKTPPPFVLFEDFGDNALVFALYFWIEMGPGVSSPAVMSDLRFMIEKRFAEAGIGIAFPQRDIHLTASRPLQVELTRGAG